MILDYPGWFNVIKKIFKVEEGSRRRGQSDMIWEEDLSFLVLKMEEDARVQGMWVASRS